MNTDNLSPVRLKPRNPGTGPLGWIVLGSVSAVISWSYLLYWRQMFNPALTFLSAFFFIFPLAGLIHLGLSRWMELMTDLSPSRCRRFSLISQAAFAPLLVMNLLGTFSRGVILGSLLGYGLINLILIPLIRRSPEKIRLRRGLFMDIGCALLLVLLVFVSYYKFTRGEVYYLEGDVHHVGYSVNLFLGRSVTQGIFPLWNPYDEFGVPIYSNPSNQYFFPLYMLVAMFSSGYGLGHFILLSFVIPLGSGAIGFFALVKCLVRRRWIAFITAVGYSFCGFAVHSTQQDIIIAHCWLPFIVLFGVRAFLARGKALKYCLAAGIVYGLTIVSTYPTLFFAIGLHLGFLAVIAAGYLFRRRRGAVLAVMGKYLSVIVLGVLLAAPYIVAIRGYLPYTDRTVSLPYLRAVGQGTLTPRSFITLWFPRTALLQNRAEIRRGGGNENILDMANFNGQDLARRSVYITLPCLIFALIALVKWKRYRGLPLVLGGISLFYLSASMGGFSFLYEWFFYLIPVYTRVRHPAMHRLFFSFHLLLLSAIGLRIAIRCPRDRFLDRTLPRILTGVVILFLVYWAYLQAAILPRFEEDLTLYNQLLHDTLFAILFIGGTLIFLLSRRAKRYRGAIITGLAILVIFDALSIAHASHQLRMKEKPTNYRDSFGKFEKEFAGVENVRYPKQARVDVNWVHSFQFVFGRSGFGGYLPLIAEAIRRNPDQYENYVTRLFRLYSRVVVTDIYRTKRFMREGRDDTAYLNQRVEIPDWFSVDEGRDGHGVGSLDILWYSPNRAVVWVATEAGALLEMVDMDFPGWRAYLDEEEIPIYRVNYCFKGVFVPPGRHMVSFVFDPPAFSWSILFSSFVFSATVAVSLLRIRPDPEQGAPPVPGCR